MASNAEGKKCRAAGGGILTGPSIRVRRWSRLQLKTLARGICGSAADRNSSGEQAGSDDESHHLAHGDGRRDGDRGRIYGGRSPKWWAFGYKRAQNKFVELVLPILNACTFGVDKLAPPTAERHTRKLTSTDVRTDPRFSPASESMV